MEPTKSVNREIKFRAWDNSEQGKEYMLGPYDITDSIWANTDIRKLDLMQYTGLKDKDGKEIYDGDVILRVKDGIEGVVYWKYDGWFVKVDGAIDARLHDWKYYCDSIQVIGNIYEQPLKTNL